MTGKDIEGVAKLYIKINELEKELKIKDKMIDKLAEYGFNCVYGIPVKFKNKEELIEIVREEVESRG